MREQTLSQVPTLLFQAAPSPSLPPPPPPESGVTRLGFIEYLGPWMPLMAGRFYGFVRVVLVHIFII